MILKYGYDKIKVKVDAKVKHLYSISMAKQVIKRGGKREPFRAEKIKRSIRAACKEARLSPARAKKAVSKVSALALRFAKKRKAVGTAILRKKVLAGLKKAEPAAVKAWLRYDKRRRARRRR